MNLLTLQMLSSAQEKGLRGVSSPTKTKLHHLAAYHKGCWTRNMSAILKTALGICKDLYG